MIFNLIILNNKKKTAIGVTISKYWPDTGASLSNGGARRSSGGFVLLSIEGAGAKHKNCVRQCAGTGQYNFILHSHEFVLLLRITSEPSV